MGKQNDTPFRPLPPQRADELEWTINKAADGQEAVIIDPDAGVTGTQPAGLISPNQATTGLVNYGRHYF
jgi:hypothetical protein